MATLGLQKDELWSKREMIHRRMEELTNEKKAADTTLESSAKERQGLLDKLKDLEVSRAKRIAILPLCACVTSSATWYHSSGSLLFLW